MKKALIVHKNNGRIICDIEPQQALSSWLGSISNGDYILSLERTKTKRSMSQNNLMWLWFGVIAEEWSDATGMTITADMVHDAYCRKFIPILTPAGYVGGNTSALDTDDFTKFLNNVQADASAEYGIELPSPEDNEFENWKHSIMIKNR